MLDARDARAGQQLDARLSGQFNQAFHDAIEAAFDVPAAESVFEVRDDGESRGRLIGRRADVGRIAVIKLSQMRAFKVRRYGAMIIAPPVAYGEMAQDRGGFHGGPVKWSAAKESLFGNLVEPRSELKKFQEAAIIARLEPARRRKPLRERGRICEARPVVVYVVAERVHGLERQMLLQRAASGLKEVLKDPGHRNK